MTVSGRVVKGIGASATFLSIPWVEGQIVEALGFRPYSGTLNINVGDRAVRETLKACPAKRIVPAEQGFCDALIFRGTVGGYPCGVILPLAEGYPGEVLEIVAPVHLRKALSLADGDYIELVLHPA
jgi:riboflavin kinase, archaea type